MVRRRDKPAPLAVKLFWAGAVVSVMILGPLLLLRADWMWREGGHQRSDDPSTTVSSRADLEDRLGVDLLGDRPWVVHGIAHGEAAAAEFGSRLQDFGWSPILQRDGTDDERFERLTVFTRGFERSGAGAIAFAAVETWPTERVDEGARRFMAAIAGRTLDPLIFEHGGDSVRLRIAGQAHVTTYLGEAPDPLPILGDPKNAPTRGVLTSGVAGWPRDTYRLVWIDASDGDVATAIEQVLVGT